jgi:hypothetical protein
VRRRGVGIKIDFLDVLTTVALLAGQAECALLQDRVAAIPERQRQAQALFPVTEATETVFAPAIGAGTGMVMREILPGRAFFTVVLAHRAPGAFGQVRPP